MAKRTRLAALPPEEAVKHFRANRRIHGCGGDWPPDRPAVPALALAAAGAAVDRLVADGRVAPGCRAGLAQFMAGLDDAQTVTFGEADQSPVKASMRGWFEGFLKSFPKQIAFGEAARRDDAADATDPQDLANAAIACREAMAGKGVEASTEAAVRHIAERAGA